MVAERFPAPAGEFIAKFVEFEVIFQSAPHQVVLENRLGDRPHGVDQLPQVRAASAGRAPGQTAIVDMEHGIIRHGGPARGDRRLYSGVSD
jgi:hypothetical protein